MRIIPSTTLNNTDEVSILSNLVKKRGTKKNKATANTIETTSDTHINQPPTVSFPLFFSFSSSSATLAEYINVLIPKTSDSINTKMPRSNGADLIQPV